MFYFGFDFFKPAFYFFVPFLTLLPTPFMYLYIRYIASDKYDLSLKSLFHLLPAFLWLIVGGVLLLSIPVDTRRMIFSQELKVGIYYENIKYYFLLTNILLFLQVFVYFGLNLFQLYKHKKTLKETYSFKENISLNWLLLFVYFLLAHNLFELVIFINPEILSSETPYFVVKVLIVFFIGIMGLRQKEIYIKEPLVEQKLDFLSPKAVNTDRKKSLPISEEQKMATANRITALMEEEKLFMQHDLSLYDLAQKLDMHKNYVSHIINDVFEANFFTYINNYRVEEAKKMLLDSNFDNLSIEGIASSVGFKTRNVFYPVFKKVVGMTPFQYKKENSKKQA